MKLTVDWSNDQTKKKAGFALRRLVKRAIRATLENEAFGWDAMVSVTFTDNEGIRKKNREFRGIDAPTDVLSFPIDIVLSLERAEEQAEDFGHSYERECAFLTVHSTLHLLGFDHVDSEEEELEMRKHQRAVMKRLGLEIRRGE